MTYPDQLNKKIAIFRRFIWISLILVYLLVIIAGFVRSSGSGMGCPDWPLCFGKWVPPIYESQLPEDYQAIYSHRGYANTQFNVFKTWTEYVNRIFGVLTGLASILLFLYSLSLMRLRIIYPVLSFLTLFLVCLQGGLGAFVVYSNLAPYMVTIHMVVAIVILLLLIYLLEITRSDFLLKNAKKISTQFLHHKRLFLLCLILLFLQVLLGTQVRESVDVVWKAMDGQNRHLWLDSIGFHLDVHKTLGLILFSFLSFFSFRTFILFKNLRYLVIGLFSGLFCEFVFGSFLVFFDLPSLLQPLHLGFAFILIGFLVQIGIRLNYFSLISYQSRVD